MGETDSERSLSREELLVAATLLLGTVFVLVYLLPGPVVLLGATVVGFAVLTYSAAFLVFEYSQYFPGWVSAVPIWVILAVPTSIAAYLVVRFDIRFSPVNALVFLALMILIFVYWLVIPSALYHHFTEPDDVSVAEWPSITVLVPAYNEEGYVGRCIDSFLEAEYPREKVEVVVVDDGSTDGTYAEAKRREGETVTVLRKENGGKHSALNRGLERATSDLIVGVDADSVIAEDALKELVRTYESRADAGAVAGNVKVGNRGSFLTNVQALEYVVSINMFRRALDLVGLVKVVPGCLGLFRRDLVEEVGGYSGDTVTEDFDLTIELLKRGVDVRYSNRALVYTEVPDTWTDLRNQRLRWFRGTVQTVAKHARVFTDARFGLLHRVLVPYMFLSVAVIPVLGVVILGTISWMVLFGSVVEFLGIFALFASLEILFSAVAIQLESAGDSEDLDLVRYAPFMVLGYKQFHDLLMLRSVLDVFARSDLGWTHVRRVRHREDSPDDGGEVIDRRVDT